MEREIKVFYFLRRSTTKQECSFEMQYQEIEAYRKTLNLPEPHPDDIFREEGPGEDPSREMLTKLLLSFKSKGYTHGFVYMVDRIGRAPEIAYEFVDLLETYGIILCDATRKVTIDVRDPFQKMLIIFQILHAKVENDLRMERVRSGLKAKAEKGYYVIPRPPYGFEIYENYENDNKKRKIIPSKEAEVIKRIFSLSSIFSLAQIAEILNREKIPYKDGKNWNRYRVYRILTNKTYCGILEYRKTVNVYKIDLNEDKKPIEYELITKKIKKNPSEWIVVQNAHEAPIDKATFEKRVLALQERRYNKSCQPKKHVYLFSGKLCCCNGQRVYSRHFSSDIEKAEEKDNFFYVCPKCKNKWKASEIEELLLNVLVNLDVTSRNPEFEVYLPKLEDIESKIKHFDANIALIEARILAYDCLSEEEKLIAIDEIKGELSYLEKEKNYLMSQRSHHLQLKKLISDPAEFSSFLTFFKEHLLVLTQGLKTRENRIRLFEIVQKLVAKVDLGSKPYRVYILFSPDSPPGLARVASVKLFGFLKKTEQFYSSIKLASKNGEHL